MNYESLHKELSDNKALVKMTEGRNEDGNGGGSSGSESDPSDDNLD